LKIGQPVLSVDSKKETCWRIQKSRATIPPKKKGEPIKVNVNDYPDPSIPKGIPYGLYNVGLNRGFKC
jgi:hypothetical protein